MVAVYFGAGFFLKAGFPTKKDLLLRATLDQPSTPQRTTSTGAIVRT